MNYKNTLVLITALMTCVCSSAVYAPASEAGVADVIKVYAADAEDRLSAASYGNNVVSAADIIKLIQAIFGNTELTSAQKANADMNGDGMISVLHLIRLKNIFL